MTLKLRPGTPADAPRCGAICYEGFRAIAEKHGFPSDIPSAEAAAELLGSLFTRGDVFSVVAENNDVVVGSNFLWKSAVIHGVGPITVDPNSQNSSVGRRMMEAVLDHAREERAAGVRLVQSAYHSRSLVLYTKLGFDVREPLAAMVGTLHAKPIPGYAVRDATSADADACNRLYTKLHGFDRAGELGGAIGERTATVVEHDGRIAGYATSIGFFGHAATEDNEGLKALISHAREVHGPGLLLPIRNADMFRWCLGNGLRVVQTLTLMSIGLYNEPHGAFLPSILF